MCHRNTYRRERRDLHRLITPPLKQLPGHERNMPHSTHSPGLDTVNKHYATPISAATNDTDELLKVVGVH